MSLAKNHLPGPVLPGVLSPVPRAAAKAPGMRGIVHIPQASTGCDGRSSVAVSRVLES